MVEGSVEGIAGFLEAIAGWGSLDLQTIGNSFVALFGGGITGALINQWFVSRREKDKNNKEAEAIRTLLKLEIDRNLEEIGVLWKGIEKGTYDRSAPSINACLSRSIMQKTAMDNLVADIPKAISDETKIIEVYKFYQVVDTVLQYKRLYQDKSVPPLATSVFDDLKTDPGAWQRKRKVAEEKEEERRRFLALLKETWAKGNPLDNP